MYTLGHDFVPPPVHAGGLRYHGDAPMLCALVKAGMVEARAYRQNETFEAALQFARTEGIIPAPEPAHAIRAAIEEALAAKEAGEERVILFGLCGHGNFDLAAYDAYLAGTLEDPEFSEDELHAALAALPEGTRRSRRCGGAAKRRRARCTAALAVAIAALAPAPAHAAVVARGSAEQVDVTGAKPGAKVTLAHGARRDATAGTLGGVVFRDVKPGPGYTVGGGKTVTVFSNRSAPPSTKVYDQKIPTVRLRLPDDARRHAAGDRRAPAARPRARTRR